MDLSTDLTSRLLEEMRSGKYASLDRLPPEIELAKQMGISRTLIRDCLGILEREGFINRKHGVGTVINRQVMNVITRMDLEKEFLAMIEDSGYKAKIAWCHVEKLSADENVAMKLGITAGDRVYRVPRLITADDRPAIYCTDYIAVKLISADEYDEALLREPIFIFLAEKCGVEVSMDVTEVRSVAATAEIAEILSTKKGAPLLYMDEVGYDFFGHPVLYSQEYYADGILHHKIVRKKI